MKNIIEARNVKKQYVVGSTEINALDGVDFEIREGEFAVVLGPSGAGKTTLLNMIGGMDTVTSGELLIDGTDVAKYNKRQLTAYRRYEVGFVFQFYNLMPNLTALENVELATEICKDTLSPEQVLAEVGLSERMANFPSQLSGGEQQRVSIARALAKNPKILLCDEPTGALDYATGKTILKLLHDSCKKSGKTVIIVTHNSALKDMADKVVYIKNGRVEKTEIIENPKDISEIEW
jgi:putative ABC transport system ATP-binding protein